MTVKLERTSGGTHSSRCGYNASGCFFNACSIISTCSILCFCNGDTREKQNPLWENWARFAARVAECLAGWDVEPVNTGLRPGRPCHPQQHSKCQSQQPQIQKYTQGKMQRNLLILAVNLKTNCVLMLRLLGCHVRSIVQGNLLQQLSKTEMCKRHNVLVLTSLQHYTYRA